MNSKSREFQIFAKPTGSLCNLNCNYCYYLDKKNLYSQHQSHRMTDEVLEEYIIQHIKATTEPIINFSWHGGEPTLLGLDFFKKIVSLQKKHKPIGKSVVNGIQTNGTLIDDEWCRFFSNENFYIGISLDGPKEFNDKYRLDKKGGPAFERTLAGYKLLQQYRVSNEILCVINAQNVGYPLEIYYYFKELGATHISFLPLVEPEPGSIRKVSNNTMDAEAFGDFLISIFDEWQAKDIGQIKIQLFEEAIRPAFNQEHTLCIFKEVCGGVPVVEHNGDFYSCDHFVDEYHKLGNIMDSPLAYYLDSDEQKAFGKAKWDNLPQYCLNCEVREMCNGECPKNRFISAPTGEYGLNYLCAGYKKFFNHCLPFVNEISRQWHQQNQQKKIAHQATTAKIGRNSPCPCGSGKKYKNCCLLN